MEKRKRHVERLRLLLHVLSNCQRTFYCPNIGHKHTLSLRASLIYRRRGNKNIVNDSKHTFATNPPSIFVFDSAVIQRGSLLEFQTSAMDGSRKRDFVRMKVLPAGFPFDLVRFISQDLFDGIRAVLDSRVEG